MPKLKSLTKLEAEREAKKRLGEETELIEQLGQSSDHRAKSVVNYYLKQLEDTEIKFKNDALEILEGLKKKSNLDYNNFLIAPTQRFISQEDLPQKFLPLVRVIANKTGIVVSIFGTQYYGAFKSCYLPLYDYIACKILAVKVGNTIARIQGYNRGSNGVLIPDSEDLKKYGGRHN